MEEDWTDRRAIKIREESFIIYSMLVFGIFVHESFAGGSKLAELTAHHVVTDLEFDIFTAVVDLKFETDKLWKNCAASCVGADGVSGLYGLRDGKGNHMGALPRRPATKKDGGRLHGGSSGVENRLNFWRALPGAESSSR